MVPGVRIDKVDAIVDGAVLETLRVEIAVRTPALTDDRSAGFDPGMYNCHQCVSGSVRNRNKKCSAGSSFNTAKHPLTLDRVSPMVPTPTELAVVNFDGLVRTTSFFWAALHKHQHDFPAEHAPVSDGMWTEAMFLLDLADRYAMHDVVSNRISWKVKLFCWKQDPCLMDLDSEHLAPAIFLRHLFSLHVYVYSHCMFMSILTVCLCMTTLTEGFLCFFLSCKANARVKPAKTARTLASCCVALFYFLCCSMYFVFFVLFVLWRFLYCLCVYVYWITATGWLPNCS